MIDIKNCPLNDGTDVCLCNGTLCMLVKENVCHSLRQAYRIGNRDGEARFHEKLDIATPTFIQECYFICPICKSRISKYQQRCSQCSTTFTWRDTYGNEGGIVQG